MYSKKHSYKDSGRTAVSRTWTLSNKKTRSQLTISFTCSYLADCYLDLSEKHLVSRLWNTVWWLHPPRLQSTLMRQSKQQWTLQWSRWWWTTPETMQLSPDMIYTAVDLFSYDCWYVLGFPSLRLTISTYVCRYVANIYFSYYEHHIYI